MLSITANTVADSDDAVITALSPVAQADSSLFRYDAACRAVAVARTVDDVQEIAAHAEAIRAYARQAKKRQLELDAAEIRIRPERRLGELMAAQRETVEMAKPAPPAGRNGRVVDKPDHMPQLFSTRRTPDNHIVTSRKTDPCSRFYERSPVRANTADACTMRSSPTIR
jgi:hypothetical protein